MFKLQNILKFKESDVRKMADNAVNQTKKQIASGKDFSNKPFQPYSREYAKSKGVSRSAVNLKLTGKMLQAFRVQRTKVKKNQEIQFLYGIKKNKQTKSEKILKFCISRISKEWPRLIYFIY